MIVSLSTESPQQTRLLGKVLSETAGGGCILALRGELGAGKTTLVQGVAEALGIEEAVTSPTFTLINEYRGVCPLYHVDLYRLSAPVDLWEFGVEEYLEGEGLVVVEWAEKVGDWPHCPIWVVEMSVCEGERREMRITPPEEGKGRSLQRALVMAGFEVRVWEGP